VHVDGVDQVADLGRPGDRHVRLALEDEPDVVERLGVERVGGRHDDRVALAPERDDLVRLGEGARDAPDELAVGALGGEGFQEREAELLAQGLEEVVLLDVGEGDQDVAEPLVGVLLLGEPLVELVGGEAAVLQEYLPDEFPARRRHRPPLRGPRTPPRSRTVSPIRPRAASASPARPSPTA